MTTTSAPVVHGPGLQAMAWIEARRFARHPLFLIGTAAAIGLLLLLPLLEEGSNSGDLLSWPVGAAFFIGLSSLVVAARLTRSTESADEALLAVPGSESRRTLALALACLVPFGAGLLTLVVTFVAVTLREPYPQEWWFGTAPAWEVWSILFALGPVACLGGALLGVLTGRWLGFPGASAVIVVVLVVVVGVGQLPADHSYPSLRLWTPWALFHSGTFEDGTARLYSGNPFFYLLYLLCLCAAAVIAAVWHDRTARTTSLVQTFAGVVVVGLACLALAMTTGAEENRVSEPNPAKITK